MIEEDEGRLRVMVVDDHAVVRAGLVALVGKQSNMQVVAEAGGVQEAIALAARALPDVVVMDVRLPDGSGVEACREIRAAQPQAQVVMLTSYADEEALLASIMAGAAGYLLKDAKPDALIHAIRAAGRGESLLDPRMASKVLGLVREGQVGQADPWHQLTSQERQVLDLIAQGLTNRDIAAHVHLSEKTVKHYVSSILGKINVGNRSAAAAWLVRRQTLRGGGAQPPQ